MLIIAPIPRTDRRLMQKMIHKTRDKNHARRLTAILMLHRGNSVSDVTPTRLEGFISVSELKYVVTITATEPVVPVHAGKS